MFFSSRCLPSVVGCSSCVCVYVVMCVCVVVGVNLFDGLRCHTEPLSAGRSSSEQSPFIHFINTSSSVTSSWLESTHTHTHTLSLPLTHTNCHLFLTHTSWVLQHFLSSAKAVVLRCVWLPPSSPSLQVYHQLLVLQEKKQAKGPAPCPHGNHSPPLLFCTISQTVAV